MFRTLLQEIFPLDEKENERVQLLTLAKKKNKKQKKPSN